MRSGSEVVAVAVRRIVLPPRALALWRAYDTAMTPLNRATPCRQSFHRGGFLRLMADPRVLKIVARWNGGCALAAATRHLHLLPWVSEAYFEELARGTGRAFAYVPILVVPRHARGRTVTPLLLRAVRTACASRWGVHDLGFDVCHENELLPALMRRALGPSAHVEPIGAQRYFRASGVPDGATAHIAP